MSLSDILGTAGSAATLGGSIASLFGSNNNVNNVSNNPNSAINTANLPYKGPIVTPGYTLAGGTLANRTPAYANANAALAQLYGNQLGGLNAFSQGLAQQGANLTPGYGQLTNSMVANATAAGQQQYGNLRDQLNQRNILGASFADNQLAQQQSENQKNVDTARATAFQQEMTARLGLNQQQMDALAQQLANANSQSSLVNQQAQQALAELGVSAGFLKNVDQFHTNASQAYANNAVSQAIGTNVGDISSRNNSSSGSGGGASIPAAFQGLPLPSGSDHKWTQQLQQFIANNDVAGYKAYLRSRGLTVA